MMLRIPGTRIIQFRVVSAMNGLFCSYFPSWSWLQMGLGGGSSHFMGSVGRGAV